MRRNDSDNNVLGSIFWVVFSTLLVLAIAMGIHEYLKPTHERELPQTTITTEIYTYFTVEYYNGDVDYVHIDDSYEYYINIHCDEMTTGDNDGHNCVLSHEHSLQFMDNFYNGYDADYLLKSLVIDLQSVSL